MGFDIHGFDEMLEQLDRLGQFNEIAPKMLEESVPILQEEVIKQAEKHRDTGEMIESIKPTGVIADKSGSYYICVRPTGVAEKGWQYKRIRRKNSTGHGTQKEVIRNMEKLVWLEFGVKGRPATPILTTATLNASPKVQKKLQEVFNREVKL